jgi:hypothetical protein
MDQVLQLVGSITKAVHVRLDESMVIGSGL